MFKDVEILKYRFYERPLKKQQVLFCERARELCVPNR